MTPKALSASVNLKKPEDAPVPECLIVASRSPSMKYTLADTAKRKFVFLFFF